MTTICGIADIDIYLLYYLDISSVLHLTIISKDQYNTLTNLDFIRELRLLNHKYLITIFNIIYYASLHNYIALMDWINESVNEFRYDETAIANAAANSNISVLNWFDKSNYKFKYNANTIIKASENGYVTILDWFDKSDYKFKYGNNAIHLAAANNHINVLE